MVLVAVKEDFLLFMLVAFYNLRFLLSKLKIQYFQKCFIYFQLVLIGLVLSIATGTHRLWVLRIRAEVAFLTDCVTTFKEDRLPHYVIVVLITFGTLHDDFGLFL